MLKIIVFDGGWGGETIAEYLEREICVAEIIRVIDWEHAPYEGKTLAEIQDLSEKCLEPYFNKVDLIVIGGYTASLALGFLQARYPEQKFVSVGINYHRILKTRNYPNRVTIIMNEILMQQGICDTIGRQLPYSTLTIPDSSDWEEQANQGELTAEIIRQDLAPYFELKAAPSSPPKVVTSNKTLLEVIRDEKAEKAQRLQETRATLTRNLQNHNVTSSEKPLIHSDVVLLLNTNFWGLKSEFESVFGYKVRVLDFRQKLLHDTCLALNLLGVDGCRSK